MWETIDQIPKDWMWLGHSGDEEVYRDECGKIYFVILHGSGAGMIRAREGNRTDRRRYKNAKCHEAAK